MAAGMKRLAQDTAIYGVSSILGRLLNWLLVPMYTRVFDGTGEFGIFTNLYAIVALLLVLLTYGMETGFFRFINKKEEQDPNRVYSTTLFSIGVTSILFILVVFIFLTPISNLLNYSEHQDFVAMMLSIAAVDAFISLPFAYLRYNKRPARFAVIKLINIFANITLNLFFLIACPWLYQNAPETISWFYRPDYGVGYVFVANVITVLLTFTLLIPDMVPAFRSKPSIPLLKQMLRYSLPILILGIAGILNQTADKILFPFLFEDKEYADEQLGIYGACFRMAAVMIMFIQAFRYAYEPFIFAKNKEESNNTKAYTEAMKYFIIFALLIFLGVMFYIDILKYFVTEDYYPGLKVVPIVMLGEIFFGIYFNLSFWYKLIDETKWGAWFSLIGLIVTMTIILVFTPVYGFIACAWASFFCNLLMMILSYFVGQKKYPIYYDIKSAFTYFAVAAILFAAGMLITIDSIIIRLLYRTVLLAIFVVFIVKRDLPLHTIPYINRFFKKGKSEI